MRGLLGLQENWIIIHQLIIHYWLDLQTCVLESSYLFLVVLQLQDQRSHILALVLPLLNALFSVRVELLLLVIKQSIWLWSFLKFSLILVLDLSRLNLHLSLLEVFKLSISLSNLLLLLLLLQMQLLIPYLPKLSELLLVLLHILLLHISLLYLCLSRVLNHLSLLLPPSLLLHEQLHRLLLSFVDLLLKDLFFLAPYWSQISCLLLNKLLSCDLLISKLLGFFGFSKLLHLISLACILLELVLFNLILLLHFLFEYLQIIISFL